MRDQRIRQDFLVGKETIERTYFGVRPCSDLGHCRRLITLLGDDGGTCLQYGGDTQLSGAPLRRPRLRNGARTQSTLGGPGHESRQRACVHVFLPKMPPRASPPSCTPSPSSISSRISAVPRGLGAKR